MRRIALLWLIAGCATNPPPPPDSPAAVEKAPLPTAPPVAEMAPDTPPPQTGPVVKHVLGEVTQDGELLNVGSVIRSDTDIHIADGSIEIDLGDNSTLRAFEKTRLRIAARSTVRLFVGKLWAHVRGAVGKKFSVETPNAVAGVRGTEFTVSTTDADTEVGVVSGEVEVSDKQTPDFKKLLKPKQLCRVRAKRLMNKIAAFKADALKMRWRKLENRLQRKHKEIRHNFEKKRQRMHKSFQEKKNRMGKTIRDKTQQVRQRVQEHRNNAARNFREKKEAAQESFRDARREMKRGPKPKGRRKPRRGPSQR